MLPLLEPIQKESLINIFIQQFEQLILSGQVQIGEKLPSERDLAGRMDVSRQVVHEGLLDLEAKGLVSLKPRSGWIVNDYRKTGSLPLLNSLFEYAEGELDIKVASSLFKARILIEAEAAFQAAQYCEKREHKDLEAIVQAEKKLNAGEVEKKVELDFEFHLGIAAASGNLVYPLLLNSCKSLYTNLTRLFYENLDFHREIVLSHESLCRAIGKKECREAQEIMKKLLNEGEQQLRSILC